MDMTYCTINHSGNYDKYLSHAGLHPMIYPSTTSPAKVYNDYIRKSKSKYIGFIHSDCTTQGLTEAIKRTIKQHPDFGALGAVGVNHGQVWGGPSREVITLDSCLIVINRDHGLLFDEQTFDSFHCHVEDMCMQLRAYGYRNYTIDIPSFEYKEGLILPANYFVHHSYSMNRLGGSWGSYSRYRTLLSWKWPNVETT